MKNNFLFLVFFLLATPFFAQTKDTLTVTKNERPIVVKDSLEEAYDPLAPSRAAFYSAVIPGLGQAYNKKYWKIPIIYAGIGTGIYYHIKSNNDYNRFRDAYKRRLAGFTDDEFYGSGDTPQISNARLEDAQRTAQKNKDVSIIVALAFYVVNIVDANVDAHLQQYNISEDLSFAPKVDTETFRLNPNYGFTLTYTFK